MRIDLLMSKAIVKWYGATSPSRTDSYYESLAKINDGDIDEAIKTVDNNEIPDIIRATAVFEMGREESKRSLDLALDAVKDNNPGVVSAGLYRLDNELVRLVENDFYGSGDKHTEKMVVEAISKLLTHSSFRVRLDAARSFATIPERMREAYTFEEDSRAFASAFEELEESAEFENDRMASHLSLAGLYDLLQQNEKAKQSYRTAIRVEQYIAGPRANLAAILQREVRAMQEQLQQGGAQIPAAQLQEILADGQKKMAEIGKLRLEEHQLLAIDMKRAEGLPNMQGLHFRYAMSCYIQQDYVGAEKHLLIAYELDPKNPSHVEGLASFYFEVKRDFEKAKKYTRVLMEMDPQNVGYLRLFNNIRNAEALQNSMEENPVEPASNSNEKEKSNDN